MITISYIPNDSFYSISLLINNQELQKETALMLQRYYIEKANESLLI